jgi:hypothetical protein
MLINIKQSTSQEAPTRCASCAHAHVITGYCEGEEIVYCGYSWAMILVPFKVRKCSKYMDNGEQQQMPDQASDIRLTSSEQRKIS